MKHSLSILAFIFLYSCSTSNKSEWPKKDETTINENKFTCNSGTEKAKKDLLKDSLFLIDYGFPKPSQNIYYKQLEKYNIYIKSSAGCIVNEEIMCYNKIMNSEIERKLGKGFLNIVRLRSDSIFELISKNK